jgi:ElaB/YqjD/DUF883 family membrane-anchored ribosome-binding protein
MRGRHEAEKGMTPDHRDPPNSAPGSFESGAATNANAAPEAAQSLLDRIREALSRTGRAADDVVTGAGAVVAQIRERPLVAVGIGLAAGYLAGLLLRDQYRAPPPTRRRPRGQARIRRRHSRY